MRLGGIDAYQSTFIVASGRTHTIAYMELPGIDTDVEEDAVLSAARSTIDVYCKDPEGTEHMAILP